MSLRTLYQTLLDSDLARLRVIAHQWNVALTAERRPDVAAELVDAMARVEAVEHVLAALRDAERDALADLLRRDGVMPWAIFVRRWGELRPVGPGRLEREEIWRDPVSPVEGLWYLGLVQRAYEARPSGQVEVAFVPEELRLYIPSPSPQEMTPPPPAVPPIYEVAGTDVLADDLVTLWAALQMDALTSSSTAAQEFAAVRQSPMDVPLSLLETLSVEQGWLRQDERDGLRPVPEPVLTWLQSGTWAQWERLVRAWMDSATWNDLAYVPTLRPDPAHGWPNEPLAARRTFLDVLRHCEPGTWYAIAGFVDHVRDHATDFLRPDGDYDTWAMRGLATDAPLRGIGAWDAIEGALIVFLLGGPLHWLGIVDVGGAASSLPVSAFRLNSAGAAILGLDDPPSLREPPSLRLNEDGVVWVPVRQRYARFQLRRIAQPVGWDSGYRYRLTPSSLALARQQRIPVSRILGFLEEATEQAVSDHLRIAIEAAYTGQDTARLEHVWLLRVADPAVLEHPSLQRFIDEQLAPGVVRIREADREYVITALARSGILPDISSL